MPNIGVPENSTDLDGVRAERMIGVGGIAYVTGEPAVPQLRAKFRDMPASVSGEWRLEVRSERTERGILDDRDLTLVAMAQEDMNSLISQALTVGVSRSATNLWESLPPPKKFTSGNRMSKNSIWRWIRKRELPVGLLEH